MNLLSFRAWLDRQAPRLAEHTVSKVGKVTTPPIPDQIDALDRAIRKLAGTDPLTTVSRILQAYARGNPPPPD